MKSKDESAITLWLRKSQFFISCIALIIIIFFLSYLPILKSIDDLIYDVFIRSSSNGPEARKILLVEVKFDDLNQYNKEWGKIARHLNAMDAKGIVFTFLPSEASQDFYHIVAKSTNIIFGRYLQQDPEQPQVQILEPLPSTFKNIPFSFGIISTPPLNEEGIYRYAYLNYVIDNNLYPSLALESAQKLGFLPKETSFATDNKYLVNFKGGQDSFNRIDVDQLLTKNIAPESIKDKVILIGFSKEPYLSSLRAPVNSDNNVISLLEFQGFALNTLLEKNPIIEMGKISLLLLLLCVGIGSLIFYFYASGTIFILLSTLFTLIFSLFYIFISWFFLIYINVWLPILPVLLVQYGIFLMISRKRIYDGDKTAKDILLDITRRLNEMIFPTDFYMSSDYWKHLMIMIEQVLSFNKMIFLEKIPGDSRISEIKALRCSLEDIHEKRRDYRRPPYSTMISSDDLIAVKDFFKKNDPDEVEFLIPLVFSGQVLGFWAFTMDSITIEKDPKFKKVVKMFADEIGELLYQRQNYRLYSSKNNFWNNFFSYKSKKNLLERLQSSFILFEKQLINFELMLQNLNSAAIFYDMFGKVLMINKKMTEILSFERINPLELTTSEFIRDLAKINQNDVRKYLEEIIVTRQPQLIPIKLEKSKISGKIKIQALIERLSQREEDVISISYKMTGFFLEIVDTGNE